MMGRDGRGKSFWLYGGMQIFLPLLVYVLGSWTIELLYRELLPVGLFLKHPAVFQGAENLLLFPLLYALFYGRDQRAWKSLTDGQGCREQEEFPKTDRCRRHIQKEDRGSRAGILRGKESLWILCASVCLSRGINHLLELTLLPQRFPGYESSSAAIYGEPLWIQVTAVVVAAPLLEELLMRGIVYRRMKFWIGNRGLAVAGSSLLFAVFHGNLVQGIYAFFLGILFAWLLERFQGLWAPVAAHGAANGAAVLANWLSVSIVPAGQPAWEYVWTAALLLAGYGMIRRIG